MPGLSKLLEPPAHSLSSFLLGHFLSGVRLLDATLDFVHEIKLLDGVLNSGVVRK